MLQICVLSQEDFCKYHKQLRTYRDKFVAHLDSEMKMEIPCLTCALDVTFFYYELVYKELTEKDCSGILPKNLQYYYDNCFIESQKYFDIAC
jgi:hypothetical protein